jgi:hypothetical protein
MQSPASGHHSRTMRQPTITCYTCGAFLRHRCAIQIQRPFHDCASGPPLPIGGDLPRDFMATSSAVTWPILHGRKYRRAGTRSAPAAHKRVPTALFCQTLFPIEPRGHDHRRPAENLRRRIRGGTRPPRRRRRRPAARRRDRPAPRAAPGSWPACIRMPAGHRGS